MACLTAFTASCAPSAPSLSDLGAGRVLTFFSFSIPISNSPISHFSFFFSRVLAQILRNPRFARKPCARKGRVANTKWLEVMVTSISAGKRGSCHFAFLFYEGGRGMAVALDGHLTWSGLEQGDESSVWSVSPSLCLLVRSCRTQPRLRPPPRRRRTKTHTPPASLNAFWGVIDIDTDDLSPPDIGF